MVTEEVKLYTKAEAAKLLRIGKWHHPVYQISLNIQAVLLLQS